MKEAKFYQKLKNNEVQCKLCSHFCRIAENQYGLCGVRKNQKGSLYSLVHEYPAVLSSDPIEKKPLFHFQPGSLTYSLGTLGCNLSCANCQNWDLSQVSGRIEKKIESLDSKDAEKVVSEAIGNGCQSIAYTYNEPTVWTEYALEIMKLARENDLKNVWVSNGFMSENCLGAILPYLDAINIDLKSTENKFYQKNCGAKLNPVLNNLKTIKEEGVHLEVTTLIIPSLSDDNKMFKELAEFIVDELGTEVPWHISRFSPEISWKLKDLEQTTKETIYKAYEIGKQAGLNYIYVGNIPGDQKENTYCPACGELAIRRLGFYVERFDNEGRCPQCDKNLDIAE